MVDPQLQGLKNFSQNIKPTMLKIKEAKYGKPPKLSSEELNSILQFYLETINYLSNQTDI
jgi:hypothetical protein